MIRRRRLTIAVLVLLVLGGGLWWSTRPKIDPRLLMGDWQGLGDSDVQCRWMFHPRQICSSVFQGPTSRIMTAHNWYVRGSKLILFPQQRAPTKSQYLWNWLSVFGFGKARSEIYQIVEFDGEVLTLEAEKRVLNTPKSIKLTRQVRQAKETR